MIDDVTFGDQRLVSVTDLDDEPLSPREFFRPAQGLLADFNRLLIELLIELVRVREIEFRAFLFA